MHALIIDDSRAMRQIICKIMSSLGFETLQAGDGKEGLEVLEANKETIEVVLVDWNMPVMNGIEFIEAVRGMPEHEELRMMMVTTETEPARMAKALMAGVDEFAMKPFTKDILVDKLKLIGVKMPNPA
ncbi:MAG: response regulator [Planctomycetota bacterium]